MKMIFKLKKKMVNDKSIILIRIEPDAYKLETSCNLVWCVLHKIKL